MQKYTIRLLLWERKADKNNRCPIVIVVTINRQKTYITTSYRIPATAWDETTHQVQNKYPDASKINAALRAQVANIESIILNRSIAGEPINIKSLKAELTDRVPKEKNFLAFLEDLSKDKVSQKRRYKTEIKRLRRFKNYISTNDINLQFLRKYQAFEHNRNMSQNTLSTTFNWLQSVVRVAVKEGVIKVNPFENYEKPRYVQSERVFLERNEREQWVKYWKDKRVTGDLYNTLTYFLLGVYTGLRYSDWANAASRVEGDLLRIRPQKTITSTGQWVVMPIGPTLKQILGVVKTLPEPSKESKIRVELKVLGARLNSHKNITTHVARHSFATMCAELKIPKSVTAEFMGITVATVEIYYHLTGASIIEQSNILRSI